MPIHYFQNYYNVVQYNLTNIALSIGNKTPELKYSSSSIFALSNLFSGYNSWLSLFLQKYNAIAWLSHITSPFTDSAGTFCRGFICNVFRKIFIIHLNLGQTTISIVTT